MAEPPRPGKAGSFDLLGPELVVEAAEGSLPGLRLDGTVSAYPSYVNRVYGLRSEEGGELVAKFYRPGRWSRAAIAEEHRFLRDCAAAEIPVVIPLELAGGESLGELILEDEAGGPDLAFLFALFPKMGGRNFDAEGDEDWTRLGSLLGRVHAAGAAGSAPARERCGPRELSLPQLAYLLEGGHLHPDHRRPFEKLCRGLLEEIAPLFEGRRSLRIHGDCHRGNILDRPGEGLVLIDFDDMMTGPAAQDLWLLLPDHAASCGRELAMLIDGYEAFRPFDRRELELVEPLRFMRMIHFLAWRARQRRDLWFRGSFPDWGGEAFWIKELEDLRDQARLVREALDGAR
ncbi:MAG TPA: serine/threonine protein kinase [Spirochaetales bacterium]|nr:serine/threonine protein kinase [Spirochaetales bacterium]HRY54447.1 serine/threonine protein kinase [Spirochaetia bacterium]HRZ63750.1 serine/threonine protein kinase [Spirochaetia bacterium]